MSILHYPLGDTLTARLNELQMTQYERECAQAQLELAMAMADLALCAAARVRSFGRLLSVALTSKRDFTRDGVLHSD
jgi:hypothetical protein